MGICQNIVTMALDFFAGSCGGRYDFTRSAFFAFWSWQFFPGASGIATGYPLDTVKVSDISTGRVASRPLSTPYDIFPGFAWLLSTIKTPRCWCKHKPSLRLERENTGQLSRQSAGKRLLGKSINALKKGRKKQTHTITLTLNFPLPMLKGDETQGNKRGGYTKTLQRPAHWGVPTPTVKYWSK